MRMILKKKNNNVNGPTHENKVQLIDILNKIRNDKQLENIISENINKPEFASAETTDFGKKNVDFIKTRTIFHCKILSIDKTIIRQ